ncbi:MAG: response regulator transcription factor [Desulfobacterales bacterium]|nr:response regulator transcription factor [Desulfobacterales bacterium]
MNSADPVIYVVDDDASVRSALERLIKSMGYRVQTFDTARAFLESEPSHAPCCLILDVRMPRMSGLELQEKLTQSGLRMPIIFISGHGTLSVGVQAMKAGASDFLEKPFEEQEILDAIRAAIKKDRQSRQKQAEIMQLRERAALLTPRESEVFRLAVSGQLNKQIAVELDVSEKTVKVHRSRVMEKMKTRSLASLVRMAEKIGLFRDSD